jgi:hypothetical protein
MNALHARVWELEDSEQARRWRLAYVPGLRVSARG